MAIVFNCSGCGRQLRAKEEAAGRKARCPQCGAVTEIPRPAAGEAFEEPIEYKLSDEPAGAAAHAPGAAAGASPPPAAAEGATRLCPYCGEPIRVTATKCKWCGEFLEPERRESDVTAGARPRRGRGSESARRRVKLPAIVMIVIASLGLVACLYNVMHALTAPPPQPDPNLPPFLQNLQRGMVGPTAAVIQAVFLLINTVIVAGAVQMIRLRSYGLAMTAAILSMVNVGSFCCVLGLPFGIWALVVLNNAQVKAAFE